MSERPLDRAAGARVDGGLAAALVAVRAAADRVAGRFLAERERWVLWLPVALGCGVALYFALPSEPPPWLGVLGLVAAVASLVAARRRPPGFLAAVAAVAVAGGFAAAQLRTLSVAAPVLEREIRPAFVSGRVIENEVRAGGRRLVLDRVRIARLDPAATPRRVRVVVRGMDEAVAPGQWVRLTGALSPPPEPAAPGAFDFARRAYFDGLGAVGFSFGSPRVIGAPAAAPGAGLALALSGLRHAVTERIRAALDGETGAVAAALLTGARGAIPEDALAAMRDAGLAHLLAISGLHIGIVAATLFFAVRALLALVEPVALRYPIKKWAAVAALAGTALYLVLSGATIPTQRAFLMGALVIAAILLDRTGITMRAVAWAAAVVLLVQPESLLGASFQMSFAAVVALVAVYEDFARRPTTWSTLRGSPRRILRYVAGVALATVVATLATAPFAIYNFDRLAAYGLAANLAAVPLTALWIMPWGLVALALMPLGLEGLALAPMGWGIAGVLAVAREVAGWPGAVALVPAMPGWGLAAAAAGGLWLCLWRGRWRWLGAPLFAASLLTPLAYTTPDVLIDGDAKLFAVRAADGQLALSTRRSARFTGDVWLRRNGQRVPAPWPGPGARLRCDGLGCIYRTRGRVVALVADSRALAEDCRATDVVIAAVPVRRACAPVTVDRFDVWREGAHAVYLEDGGVRIESVAAARGDRPWTRRRGGDRR